MCVMDYFNKNLKNGTQSLNGDFENLAEINAAMKFLNWQWDFPFRRNLTKKFGSTAPQRPYLS